MWELIYPHLYLGRRVIADSGGAGKNRGGCGFESLWMIHNSNFVYTYQIPGIVNIVTNYGIFGGYGGGPGYVNIAKKTDLAKRIAARRPIPHSEGDPARPDIERLLRGAVLTGKDAQYISEPLGEGALYEKLYLPGGGGFGDPLDRDLGQIERDLSLRFITERAARKLYGAVGKIGAEGEWIVDRARSEKLRARMRKARLARAEPVQEWWRKERKRVARGKITGATAQMYAECLGHSPNWAKDYREFWALPKDFSFAAAPQD
jgi:acetone carboxylase alpha subunit